MSKYSGDLVEIGIGKETTRGTAVPPTYGYKWDDNGFVDKTIMAVDESRSGILEDSRNSFVAGSFANGDLKGPLRDQLTGLILLATMGSVADASVESGVYDHTYDVSESNQHTSLTIHKKEPNQGVDHPLAMIDSLEIDCLPNNLCSWKAAIRSKARISTTLGTFTVTIASPGVATLSAHGLATGDAVVPTTTGALPTGLTAGTTYYVIVASSSTFKFATTLANALANTAINTSGSQSGTHTLTLANRYVTYASENTFLGSKHTTFKLASTQSGLGAASAINVRSAKLTIKKNAEDDRALGSVAPVDIINRLFSVSLEVQLVISDQTYLTALLAGTSYAARLDMNNTDVTIGATSNPRLYFDLYKVILQDAPPSYKRGDLTLIDLKFMAHYSESDTKMIRAILRNTVASY